MLFSLTGWAQEPAEPKETVPDFSRGFEMLKALGLPDVKGAAWGKFETERGYLGRLEDDLEDLEVALSGGGWRFPGEEKSGDLIMGGGTDRQSVRFKRKVGVIGKIFGSGANRDDGGGGVLGTWTPAEVSGDAKAIVRGLTRFKTKLADPDPFSTGVLPSSHSGDYSMMTNLLILACQFHENGFVTEANQLAEAIFSLHRDPSSVIDGVVTLLANKELAVLTKRFGEDYDWTVYANGLQELTKKYPRGWSKLGAVRILLPKVEARSSGQEIPVPALDGVTFSPEVLAHFAALTQPQEMKEPDDPKALAARLGVDLESIPEEMWEEVLSQFLDEDADGSGASLPAAWPLMGPSEKVENASPFEALSAMKMDGVIALAALVTDETLMPQVTRHSYRFGVGFDPSETLVAKAEREYQSMKRPITRGEAARQFLTAALPDRASEFPEYSPEELQEHAVDWWKTHKDAAPLELAREYMLEGGSSQKIEIAGWLAKEGSAEAGKVMEDALFSSDSLLEMASELEAYLRVKKKEGKGLFEKYAEGLRDEVASGADDGFGRGSFALRRAGGVEGFLKQLEVHVTALKPEDLVKDVLAGDMEAETAVELLNKLLEEEPREHTAVLLEAAGKLEASKDRVAFLEGMLSLQYTDDGEPIRVLTAEEWTTMLAQTRAHWVALIEDTRALGSEYYSSNGTVRDLAGLAMESLSGEDTLKAVPLWEMMGPEFGELLSKRSAARLAGEDIPKYPDPSQVDETRRGEIAKAVKEAQSSVTLIELYEGLSWSEKLAWDLIIESLEETTVRLSSLDRMVTKSVPSLEDVSSWKVGTAVDAKNLKSVVKELRGKLKKHSEQKYLMKERSGGPGYEVVENDSSWAHLGRDAHLSLAHRGFKEGVYVVVASSFGRQLDAVWPAAGEESSEEVKEQQDKLWHLVDSVLSKERPQSIYWVLVPLDAEAMKKKVKESEQDP